MKTNQVGMTLKRARIEAGYSQSDLAARLGYKTPQYISNYERGICLPSLKVLGAIVKELEMDEVQQKTLIFSLMDQYRGQIERAIGRDKMRVRR